MPGALPDIRLGELARLSGADNFRDLAGTGAGYPVDGGRMRRGVIYRSNHLTVSEADLVVLNGLAITAVHDLRLPDEIARHPDADIAGAVWRSYPIGGMTTEEATRFSTPEETYQAMLAAYRSYVGDPANRESLGALLRTMAKVEGPQVFHCAAGKDRTGWAAVVLQSLLGAAPETILEDYLLTAEYSSASTVETVRRLADVVGAGRADVLQPAVEVRPEYLQAGFDEVERAFGGLDGYLDDGLGVGPDVQRRLREHLVEAP
jgi:protein-tyrosine phosphatase